MSLRECIEAAASSASRAARAREYAVENDENDDERSETVGASTAGAAASTTDQARQDAAPVSIYPTHDNRFWGKQLVNKSTFHRRDEVSTSGTSRRRRPRDLVRAKRYLKNPHPSAASRRDRFSCSAVTRAEGLVSTSNRRIEPVHVGAHTLVERAGLEAFAQPGDAGED